MHLIGRTVHHHAGNSNGKSTTPNSEVILDLFVLICFQVGSLSSWTWHVRHNQSGPWKMLCGVVGCFRSEKPPFRDVEPTEHSLSDLRRSLAQPRPSALPQNKPRMPQTHFFVALHFQRQGGATTTSRLPSDFR